MEQQVRWLEGQGEALDTLAEVKGVPQVVMGGVYKQVLKKKKIQTLAQQQNVTLYLDAF